MRIRASWKSSIEFAPVMNVYQVIKHEYSSDADARAEIAGKIHLHRGTHSDIVMRDVMWKLRRIAGQLGKDD